MKKVIERIGPERVILVVIDGGADWSATADMIQATYPWISFLHCTSHEVSLILKDCFKKDGGIPELAELDEWMTDAQHWFSTHAVAALRKALAQDGETVGFVWPALTRYCGLLLKTKRFFGMRDLLRRVVNSGVYLEKNFVDDPFPAVINAAEKWQLMERVIKCMGPLLLLCRLADGQKPIISKLYGTLLYVRSKMEEAAQRAGAGSVEDKICNVFLSRWSEMQNDLVLATYMLEPLFVDKSRTSADCTIKLWAMARKVLQINNDAEWNELHGVMVRQLAQFQGKGAGLVHMASPSAWVNLHSQCALQWWLQWGTEVSELQRLALKIVPLMIGSGPAERTWKDVGNILTKNRNRLGIAACIDLVFVRTWLRRELKLVTDEELEQLKGWETELLQEASFYTGTPDPDSGTEKELRIFEDTFEAWEQPAINGQGVNPAIRLGEVRRSPVRFRLQEKYKGVFLLDKDPSDDYNYYSDAAAEPAPQRDWENRKIVNLVWENRRGWRAETKLCSALTDPSENYIIDAVLIRMIKDSRRNIRTVRFRSEM